MTTVAFAAIVLIAVAAVALLAWSLCRVSARADRRAHQEWLLAPYEGKACRVCGGATPYSDCAGAVHPECWDAS